MTKAPLLALLAALSLPALAQSSEWTTPSATGGEIRISTELCATDKLRLKALFIAPGGQIVTGCWKAIDDEIEVAWHDRTTYRYKIEPFRKRK